MIGSVPGQFVDPRLFTQQAVAFGGNAGAGALDPVAPLLASANIESSINDQFNQFAAGSAGLSFAGPFESSTSNMLYETLNVAESFYMSGGGGMMDPRMQTLTGLNSTLSSINAGPTAIYLEDIPPDKLPTVMQMIQQSPESFELRSKMTGVSAGAVSGFGSQAGAGGLGFGLLEMLGMGPQTGIAPSNNAALLQALSQQTGALTPTVANTVAPAAAPASAPSMDPMQLLGLLALTMLFRQQA